MSWHLRAAGREHVVLDRRADARRRLAGPLGRVPARRRRTGRPACPASPTTAPTRTASCPATRSSRRIGRVRRRSIDAPVRLGDRGHAADARTAERRARFRLETRARHRSGRARSSSPPARSTRRRSRRGRAAFAPRIRQLHSHDYRNPARCRPAACCSSVRPDGRPARRGTARGRPRRCRCRSGIAAGPRGAIAGTTSSGGSASSSTRGPELGTPLPTVDQLPDPRAAVRLQPAPVGSRRRPRHEPAADGARRDPPRRAVRAAPTATRAASPRTSAANLRVRRRVLRPARSGGCATRSPSGPAIDAHRRRSRAARRSSRPRSPSSISRRAASRRSCGRPATRRTTPGSTCRSSTEFGVPRHVARRQRGPRADVHRACSGSTTTASANLGGVARDAEYLASRGDAGRLG